jgi:hypothetical protein
VIAWVASNGILTQIVSNKTNSKKDSSLLAKRLICLSFISGWRLLGGERANEAIQAIEGVAVTAGARCLYVVGGSIRTKEY